MMNTSERVLLPIKRSMRYLSKLFNNSISFQIVAICFLVSSQFVISGCATRKVMLDRAVVINATAGIITEVKVRHEPTGKIGAVNMILPQKSFDLGFQSQPMLARESVVTWTDQNGQQRRTVLSLPKGLTTGEGQAMILVYTIHPSGDVTVELKD